MKLLLSWKIIRLILDVLLNHGLMKILQQIQSTLQIMLATDMTELMVAGVAVLFAISVINGRAPDYNSLKRLNLNPSGYY